MNKFYQAISKVSIDSILYSEFHTLLVLYQRLLINFKYTCNHLWFNLECKKMGVFPNYINLNFVNKSKSSESKKSLYIAKKCWLKFEIKKHYKRRDNISAHQKIIYSELSARLHPCEFIVIREKFMDKAQQLSHKQFIRQKLKLNSLLNSSVNTVKVSNVYSDVCFYSRLINKSSTVLTPEEEIFLRKGLNYAPNLKVNSSQVTDLAVHIDAALSDSDLEGRVVCAKLLHLASKNVKKTFNSSFEDDSLIRSIKHKIKKDDLILSKSDKGNTVSIFPKSIYMEKMMACLQGMRIVEMQSDPTAKYKKDLIKVINNCKMVFSTSERFQIKNCNPSAPILYGLPKLHKEGIPCRPVASSFNAPASRLCKALSKLLPSLLDFNPKFSIKNSSHLIDKLKVLEIPTGSKLISFDVKSLFPSIPTNKLLSLLCDRVREVMLDPVKALEIIDLIKICFDQNYFMFNNKFYKQIEGLAMGSSFSPFCAEFFMNYFENELFKSNHYLIKNIFRWYRYVDDVFCIWTGSTRQLNCFLNKVLNKIDKNIQFTLEIGDRHINFLDLSLSINDDTNMFDFNIFRKDTFTDIVIPNSSAHPLNTKKAAFWSMLNRLVNVPLSRYNYMIELKTIIQIAVNNGYTKDFVYRLLHRIKHRLALKSVFPVNNDNKNKNWKKIPYIPNFSDVIKNKLISFGIQPAFANQRNIKNLLSNNKIKPLFDILQKSGVYKIKCGDCEAIYIGKTKRNLKTRFIEHKRGATTANPTSGLSQHLKSERHECSIENLELLHQLKEGRVLEKYEILEIKRSKKSNEILLNNQLEFLNKSPLLEF